MLRLVITVEGETRRFPLRIATATLGSSADNDIVISGRGVSRRHATLTRRDGGVLVEDVGSKNGLIVEGRRVPRVELAPGDAVQLGRAIVLLEQIPTPDDSIALIFSPGRSTTDSFVWAEHSLRDRSDDSGPRAAWRLVREIELDGADARSVPRLLERAREAIGADCIVAFSRRSNDVAIIAVAGMMPEHDDLATVTPASNGWIAIDGAVNLAARLPERKSRAPWRRDFLAFIRARLFDRSQKEKQATEKTSPVEFISLDFIAGPSAATERLMTEVGQIARSRMDVIVTGETGVGKELVARMIHDLGPTAGGPYVAVNCTTLVGDLADSDLFGVVRGAATGVEAREGFFAAAEGGTIFLDEIGDMPLKLQPKLLRVLQEREIIPVGSSRARRISVRLISSTNRDIEQAVAEGRLRTDLKYRLGVEIRVPPLRERRDDIPHLVVAFTAAAAARAHKRLEGVSRTALSQLIAYDWPGNVRELKLVIERAVLMCGAGGVVDTAHLGLSRREAQPVTHLDTLQRDTIIETLRQTRGNKAEAARLLGISRQGLYAMLKRHRLE